MNYLALAQRLRRKCRVSGNGPTALTGQTEEYNRLLDWVNEAWILIQRTHTDWRWMRASASAQTVQGQATYSPTTDFKLKDFGYWALDYENDDTFRNYITAAGTTTEIFMALMADYDQWRDTYLYGALRTSYTRPIVYALAPDDSIACGPIPLAGYTLIGDYYRVPTELVLATDVPAMPAQFHMAIVYRAMMYYGASEAAPEVYNEGRTEFDRIIRELEATYLRRARLPGPLA